MKTKLKYLFCCLLMIPRSLGGQDISVDVDYPAVVTAGEQFEIKYSVNSGGGELTVPSFEGFYKLMGPQTSYSSSTQIINGRMTQSTSYSYIYVLQALKEGKYTIAPATYTYKGKTFRSDSVTIGVIGSKVQQKGQTPGNVPDEQTPQTRGSGSDLFLDLSLNRRSVYIGEPIVATIKIYTKVNLAGINEIKYPSFNGFLKSDIETPPLTSLRNENVNGAIYGSGVVQQFLLFPQISGEIQIDPVQISVLVQQKTGRSDPFFGDFFSSYQTVPRAVISQAEKVNVKPLPGTKPADFSGLVGKVQLNASIDKDSVNVNDAINLKLTVSGSGNLKLAAVPGLKLTPDIEVYDPKITDNLRNSTGGTTGQKSFEFLLIPRHYGDFTIPPVTYSYFDPANSRYERLSTKEFRFHVKKGSEQATGVTVYGGVSKSDVKYVGQDIRFIRSDPGNIIKPGNIIFSKPVFYSFYAITAFLFLLFLLIRREHIKRNADISLVRNRKAAKIAGRRLKEASHCLKNQQTDKFYEAILKGLWGYLSDKLSIPLSDLTRNAAVEALKEKGIPEENINDLTKILDVCEFARFAPASTGTEMEKIYAETSKFIRSVENIKG
jgi:hypothetical protein